MRFLVSAAVASDGREARRPVGGPRWLSIGDPDALGGLFATPVGCQNLRKTMATPTLTTAANTSVRLYRGVAETIHLVTPKVMPTTRPNGQHLLEALLAVHDGQQQERHDEAQDRRDPSGDGRDGEDIVKTAGLGGHQDREADGTEGDGDGVGEQRDHRRAQGGESDRHEHGGGDRHGGAEAGEGLEQAAEAEGDQEGEHARVVADEEERAPEVLEAARCHRHLVHPDGGQQDPHDGEDAVDEPVGAGGQSRRDRHAERGDRHDEGHGPGEGAGVVGLPAQERRA